MDKKLLEIYSISCDDEFVTPSMGYTTNLSDALKVNWYVAMTLLSHYFSPMHQLYTGSQSVPDGWPSKVSKTKAQVLAGTDIPEDEWDNYKVSYHQERRTTHPKCKDVYTIERIGNQYED
jgi:hypothetical protein